MDANININIENGNLNDIIPSDIIFSWENLNVSAKNTNILNNISGKIDNGLTAIMGESGSGKTTLLNIISKRNRIHKMTVKGDILLNGKAYNKNLLKKISAYVMQDDLVHYNLSVYENILFTSQLKLPKNTTYESCLQRTNEIIKIMRLENIKDILVGNDLIKGISGGERKRLCIGIEIVNNPLILLLDEPTSGLDSFNSLLIVKILKELLKNKSKLITLTIHQPQKDIVDLFENIILMNKGNIVYQGKMETLHSYFANQGLIIVNENPFIQIIESLINYEYLLDNKITYLNNYHLMDIEQNISYQKISWLQQLTILLKKNFLLSLRSWQRIFVNLLITSVIAIFVGLSVWNDIGTNKKSFTLRQPSLFFCVISQGIISSIQGTHSFTLDRNLMIRERDSGTYNISAYFFSKTICENVIQSLSPILFTCIVYPLIGYASTTKQFFYFMLFMILDSISATSLANMVCCICQSIELSSIVLSLLFEISRLYGGWFIPPKLINTQEYDKWRFADTMSYIKYAFVGVSLNENSNLLLTCDQKEYVNGACSIIPAQISPFTGSKINHFYGYDEYTIQYCFGALVIYIITCRIISYISLRAQ